LEGTLSEIHDTQTYEARKKIAPVELFELEPNKKAWRQIWAKKVLGTTTVRLSFLFAEFRQRLWTPSHYFLWKTSLSSDSISKRRQSYI